MIWKRQKTVQQLNEFCKNTMVEAIGIEFTEVGPDFLKAKMPVDRRTIQPMGLLHGGASVALAESLGSVAANLCLEEGSTSMPVGLEINANHLRSIKEGFVIGITKPLHLGRRTQVWNTEIFDGDGRLICTSRLTVALV